MLDDEQVYLKCYGLIVCEHAKECCETQVSSSFLGLGNIGNLFLLFLLSLLLLLPICSSFQV